MAPSRGIHRLAAATAAATFALLFVGGLVTSTGSGLAVPDWPLSFGRFFPPMVGGVLFEHGHRLAATLVGCLTVVLALSVVIRESRPSVRARAARFAHGRSSGRPRGRDRPLLAAARRLGRARLL